MIRSGAETLGPLVLALLLAGLASLGPAPANADDLAQARRHFAEGERRFAAGDWARAFEAYEAAYEAAPLADLLFNMGQCQRKLGNAGGALELFRRFLDSGPPAEQRALVMDLVRELEAQEPQVAPEPPSAEPEPPPPMDAHPAPPEPRETTVTRPPARELPPREPASGGPTAAFWVVGGAGAAALITTGVLTVLAEAGRSQFLDRIDAGDPEGADELVDGTDALYLARNVTAIVSAVALVGAAVLLLVGPGSDAARDEHGRGSMAFDARLLPGGAIVEGGGRW